MKSNASWVIEQRQAITSVLLQLPASQRQVVELAYFSGLSQQEIASRLDSRLDTVKTRARLGLRRRRAAIARRRFAAGGCLVVQCAAAYGQRLR